MTFDLTKLRVGDVLRFTVVGGDVSPRLALVQKLTATSLHLVFCAWDSGDLRRLVITPEEVAEGVYDFAWSHDLETVYLLELEEDSEQLKRDILFKLQYDMNHDWDWEEDEDDDWDDDWDEDCKDWQDLLALEDEFPTDSLEDWDEEVQDWHGDWRNDWQDDWHGDWQDDLCLDRYGDREWKFD